MKTEENKLASLCEALLFASGEPLDVEKTAKALSVNPDDLRDCFVELQKKYSDDSYGVEILSLNDKFQFVTKKEYEEKIRTVLSVKKNAPLSSAAFEVLAVVAYNQPVTKSFIEQVRGVDCSGVISTLCQKNLIEEHGRLDLPGRPLLYCTTENFLKCFEMSSLDDLPALPEKDVGNDDAQEDNDDDNTELNGQMSLI